MERRSTRARAAKANKEPEKHSVDEDNKPEEESEDLPERRTKKAAAKPPAQITPAAAPSTVVVKPRKRGATNEDLHGLELLDILSKHSQSVTQAAKDWVKGYKQDKAPAVTRLMTLIAQVAGYEEVSEEDVEEGDIDNLIKKMTVQVLKANVIDPLHDKRLKTFPTSYETFWTSLISELHQTGLLLDDYLISRVTAFVTGLSCSLIRNFRYCGIITCSHIMTGWVEVQKIYRNNIARFQFQAGAEEKKKVNKELAESLKLQAEAENKRSHDLDAATKSLIAATFAVRFRDHSEEVRGVVIKSFSRWVEKAPDLYLQDTHLKYLGWALSDKDGLVRYEAAHGVLSLYKARENVPLLAEFKGRFEKRFREMSRDADERVAIKALELLSQLVEHDQVDRESVRIDIYPLLATSSAPLRQAASSLVATLLLDTASQLEATKVKEAEGEGAGPTTKGSKKAKKGASKDEEDEQTKRHKLAMQCQLSSLLDLIEILAQVNPVPNHPNLAPSTSSQAAGSQLMEEENVIKLVDCLYGRLPVLGDCRSLLSALIDDDLVATRGKGGAIHVSLLLAASVQKASGSSLPSTGPSAKASIRKAGPSGAQGDNLMELSLEMISALPALFKKHQSEGQAIRALIGLIPHLRLEVYTMGGREKEFGSLVKQVADQLFRHADDEKVLAKVADTLNFCSEHGPASLQPAAQLLISETVIKASNQLSQAANQVKELDIDTLKEQVAALHGQKKDKSVERLYNLKCALSRISTLLVTGSRLVSSHDQVYECLHSLVDESVKGRKLGVETTRMLLCAMNSILGWSLARLQKMPGGHVLNPGLETEGGSGGGAAAALPLLSSLTEALGELRNKINIFIKQLLSLYSPLSDPVQDEGEEGVGQENDPMSLESSNARMCDVTLLAISDVLLLFTGQTWVDEEEKSKAMALAQAASSKEGELAREILLGIEAPDDAVRKLWVMCQDQLKRSAPVNVEGGEGRDRGTLVSFAMRLRALGALAKLLRSRSCLSHRHFRWLAAHLASKMVSYGPEAQDIIKDLLRACRTNRPSVMPEVYVGAMKLAYNTVIEERQVGMNDELTEGSSLESVHLDFKALCENLAAMYVGHSIHRDELMRIVRNGVSFAMNDAPSNITFLSWGLACFTAKLTQEDALVLAGELDDQIKESLFMVDEPEWMPLNNYLQGVKSRAEKGRGAARGAIKGSKGADGGARARRISFAVREGEEEEEEEEEEVKKEEVGKKRGRKEGGGGGGKGEGETDPAPPSKKPTALAPADEVTKPAAGARATRGAKEAQKQPAPAPAPVPAPAAEVHEASQMTTGSIEPPAKSRRRR